MNQHHGHSPARLLVLISGNGSNLQAIIDAIASGELRAEVCGVISSNPKAFGLVRAAQHGIPSRVVKPGPSVPRRQYDASLAMFAQAFQPDLIILAGWMRLLTSAFLAQFPRRVINLHPALPGAFPGLHAIERAYTAFLNKTITATGVMVHLVPDEGVDTGPVLNQVSVPMDGCATLADLKSRVHAAEHRLLVDTLNRYIPQILKNANPGAPATQSIAEPA